MKKKIVLFMAILAMGVITSFNMNLVENEWGDISIQNIEALSFGESGGGVFCVGTGSLDCPNGGAKVYFIW